MLLRRVTTFGFEAPSDARTLRVVGGTILRGIGQEAGNRVGLLVLKLAELLEELDICNRVDVVRGLVAESGEILDLFMFPSSHLLYRDVVKGHTLLQGDRPVAYDVGSLDVVAGEKRAHVEVFVFIALLQKSLDHQATTKRGGVARDRRKSIG